ncbi:MAG: response regulator [FCB group bacterium]|nr:response regulator [FCB group bacterium]
MSSGALFEKYRGIKIMVVDDEKIYHDILKNILASLGFTVCEAFDGLEALTVFEDEAPWMVFSDLYMPKKNGLMMAREIQRKNKDVPIILMTGSISENSIVFSPDLKIISVILKPFKLGDVILALEQALQNIDDSRDSRIHRFGENKS